MPTYSLTRAITHSLTRKLTDPGVGGWTPAQLYLASEQGAWYDPGDLSTLSQTSGGTLGNVAVGDPVGKMLDKSGNGKHFTQPVSALRPILRQDSNGFYYLEGDNTQKWMSVIGSAAYFKFLHDGTGGTLGIAAALEDTPAVNASRWLMHTNEVTTSYAGLGIGLNTYSGLGSSVVRIGNGSTNVINNFSTNGDFRTDGIGMHLVASYKSQSGADFRYYLDGSQGTPNGFESNAPTSGNAYNDLTLFTTNASAYFRGKFYGAVIVAREISSAERQNLARYLRGLYGDTGYLLGVGDSHTYNTSYSQNRSNFYPARLDLLLRPGHRYSPLNYGVSGDSTLRIITRLAGVTEAGRGTVAVIYAGTNDLNAATTVQAAPAPTTTTFTVGAGKGVYYSAGGQITVNGVACIVQSVATDAITLTAPLGFTPVAGQAVLIDTQTNLVTIGNALKAAGYSQLLVCGQHYLNFASDGDTVATPLAALVALRALQSAAAATLGAVYVDFHAYMRQLIVAGTYTQGDDTAWHVAVGNAHLNNTGEQILADAIFAAMQAQGWA